MGSAESLSAPIIMSRLRRLSKNRFVVTALLVLLLPLFLWTLHRNSPVQISVSASITKKPHSSPSSTSVSFPPHKYAFAAFLAESENPDPTDDNSDNYFVATRILAYQLLHAPSTRSPDGIPLLVLCTEDVSQSKRDRLAADGATIVPIDRIRIPWMVKGAGHERWKDQLTKLRLWTLTNYERVLYVDSDMLLTRPLDSVFADPSAAVAYRGNSTAPEDDPQDEGPMPESYVMGGVSGQGSFDHPWPPKTGKKMNGGFVLLRPDMTLFNYYMRVASVEGRFDPNYMEQALFNYVHRKEGNLPWAQLNTMSSVNRANARDATEGVLSLHVKWWKAEDETVAKLGWRLRWEMEGASEARDANKLLRKT